DSLINGISQTLGLIVDQKGDRNEYSVKLSTLLNKLYGLDAEKIHKQETAKLVKEKFKLYKL
ncbi:hypothetical protein Q7559_11545, partial [Glaesserella parasuis]|uniref:hypothetical protein n=1 Tax=Glaesserella parasuis TaxID=738 RepID=UPI0027223FC8|nr:hypothetical protein [Glaesserella parasuis]